MPVNWDQYAAPAQPSTDKWAQYQVTPQQSSAAAAGPPQTLPQEAGAWLENKAAPFLKNLGIGAGTVLPGQLAKLDAAVSRTLGPWATTPLVGGKTSAQAIADERAAGTAHGTAQKIGQGIGNVGEFLLPGLGEEAATAKLGRLAPLGRIGYSALTSGLVNKAQGGGFGAGAAAGGVAGGVGEGLKALAPALAESALGIRKLDRAYGRTPGRAILDETKGFSPGAVAESAQGRLDELNPRLESLADAASRRPLPPVRGLLPPPTEEIPLGTPPGPGEMPGALIGAEPFPPQNIGTARVIRAKNGQILSKAARKVEFPDESGRLPIGRNPNTGRMLSRDPSKFFTRDWRMSGSGEPMFPDAEQISGPGVLLRRPEITPGLPPETIPNRIGSLESARSVVGNAINAATQRNAAKEVGQLTPLDQFLRTRFDTGEPISSQVTPRELLDLRRGFGSEFVHNWNPETMPGVTGTARNTYHALSGELHDIAPETAPLDRRISSLIPVARRAESRSLNAPFAQRVAGRLAAHTGALASGIMGGYQGYEHGKLPGAIAGGLGGLLLPELISSPTGEMVGARALNNPGILLRSLTGTGLDLGRANKQKSNNQ